MVGWVWADTSTTHAAVGPWGSLLAGAGWEPRAGYAAGSLLTQRTGRSRARFAGGAAGRALLAAGAGACPDPAGRGGEETSAVGAVGGSRPLLPAEPLPRAPSTQVRATVTPCPDLGRAQWLQGPVPALCLSGMGPIAVDVGSRGIPWACRGEGRVGNGPWGEHGAL